jgi:phosphoglycolate phosphatase-like HAD superfamily hydrolase
MSVQVRAVFFDIDGTLVDSNELHVLAWHQAFLKHGQSIALHAIRRQIGKGGDLLLPALLPDSERELRESVNSAHGDIFHSRYLHQVKPFPRASELIKAVSSRGIKTLIASSAKKPELDYYVRMLGVTDLLTGAVTSEDVETSKPAADIFAVALQKAAPAQAAQTLAIGDTIYDVSSALKSNIRTIALRTGPFSDAELQQAGAIAIYNDVAALFDDLDTALRVKNIQPQTGQGHQSS